MDTICIRYFCRFPAFFDLYIWRSFYLHYFMLHCDLDLRFWLKAALQGERSIHQYYRLWSYDHDALRIRLLL